MKAAKKMAASNIPAATAAQVDALQKLLNQKVIETSLWTIEAGLYIHYCLYKLLASGDQRAIDAEFNRDLEPQVDHYLPYFMQLNSKLTKKQPIQTAEETG